MMGERRRLVPHASHWGPFLAEVEDGRLVGVRPVDRDRKPSPILQSIPDAVYGPTRIDRPYVRAGFLAQGPAADRTARGAEPFVPVSWDTALTLVANEVGRVKSLHGNTAIFAGSYGWSSAGRLHHARSLLHRFTNGFGGSTQQVTNYSYAAGMVVVPRVVGDARTVHGPTTSWDGLIANTTLLVAFGGLPAKNMQIESGGGGERSGPEWLRRLAQAKVPIVHIGPIRSDVDSALGAEWLSPAPGTDTALMLALAHTLFAEGRHDQAFLERYTVGHERLRAYIMGESDGQPKDSAWAASITGLDAAVIRALARRMAANRTFLTMSWGLQRAEHGEQPFWMLIALAAMLGQIGLPGGGYGFGYGSMCGMGNPRPPVLPIDRPAGPNPTRRAIPVARIADMLLHPGTEYDFDGKRHTYPEIRLVYWCGGNPFHHHQDINRLLRAWQRPETIIVHDIWWTATARHADIVLPATTSLERNDIASSPLDRYYLAMHQAIPPVGQARNDFDIFADLAARLGFAEAFTEGRSEMDWLRSLYDVVRRQAGSQDVELPEFDAFWAAGHAELPAPRAPFVAFADFRADPDSHRLRTPSGRIELYSETIASFGYDDCPPHPTWIEPREWLRSPVAERHPLHLLSTQPRHRLHGQMDQGRTSLMAKVQGREPILMNPKDAAARGIANGDVVRVFNNRGACLAGAMVSDDVRQGVVCLQAGAWYDPLEPGRIGSLDRHGNANVLTPDRPTSRLAQGPTAHSTLVEVVRHEAPVPPITVFAPPALQAAE